VFGSCAPHGRTVKILKNLKRQHRALYEAMIIDEMSARYHKEQYFELPSKPLRPFSKATNKPFLWE